MFRSKALLATVYLAMSILVTVFGQTRDSGALPSRENSDTTPVARDSPMEYQSYLAHVAAAGASLRLNEKPEATRWLDGAPAAYRGWEWHLLKGQSDRCLSKISTGDVRAIELDFSPDGTLLAAAMENGEIRLYGVRDGSLKTQWQAHDQAVYAARFNPQGTRIVSCSRDGTLALWETDSAKLVWKNKHGGEGLADAAFDSDGKSIGFCSWYRSEGGVIGFISLWDLTNGLETWRTNFENKPIVSIRFRPHSNQFAVGTWNFKIGIWDAGTKEQVQAFDFDDSPIYSAIDEVAFSPDGKDIVAACKSGSPRVWSLETSKLRLELHGHRSQVHTVAYSADGQNIYTAGAEGVIIVWNAANGLPMIRLLGHDGNISSIAVDPAGNYIASCSADHTIRLWSVADTHRFTSKSGRSEWVYGCAISRDGRWLATGGAPEEMVSIWDVTTGERVRSFDASNVNAAGFGPDGLLVTCNWSKEVKVWDTKRGVLVRDLPGQEGGATASVFSRNGKWVATASAEKAAVVWDFATGEVIKRLPHEHGVWSVDFSEDDSLLASGDQKGKLSVWKTSNWEKCWEISAHEGTTNWIDFAPDGKRLATGGGDGIVRIWRATDGKVERDLKGHSQLVWSIAFHPDGKRLASGSGDKTVRLWDVERGVSVLTLSDFSEAVYNVAFTPDGRRLIVNAMGQELAIYESASPTNQSGIED